MTPEQREMFIQSADSEQKRQRLTLEEMKSRAQLRLVMQGLKVDKVYGERVMVELVQSTTEMDAFEQRTGLVAPGKERHTPAPSVGIVIAIGESFLHRDTIQEYDVRGNATAVVREISTCPLKVGDAVMFSRYAGSEYRIENNNFKILDIREVFCSLKAVDGGGVVEEPSQSTDRSLV